MAAGQDRASVVASGFLTLLASQIGTRLVTFIINLLIARHLSPEAYGLSSVQFHLLTTTALFISREGFRRGCLRFGGGAGADDDADAASDSSKSSNGAKGSAGKHSNGSVGKDSSSIQGSGIDNRAVLRVAWLVVPLGVVVTAAVCGLAIWRHDAAVAAAAASTGAATANGRGESAAVPYYREAVLLHGLAALVELAAEPFYILASVHLMFGPVEPPAGSAARSAATGLPPALVFSAAQLALAAVALAGYGAVGWRLLRADKRAGARSSWLSRWTPQELRVLGTSAVFTLQAVEKLALAEGSKVVLATMQSAVNQRYSPTAVAVCVLGLAAAAFGPAYAYTLLRLVYGTRWSETEAPAVLAAYSVYVLLLALNGIGEAFVHAVLDARGLQASNALLLLFAGAHVGACVGLVGRLGALGMVAADAANMVLRIAYSAWCIRRFFRPLPCFSLRRDLLPSSATLAAFAVAACAAGVSNYIFLVAPGVDGSTPQRLFLRRAAPHVAVAFGLLAVVGGVMLRAERATLRQVMEMRRRRGRGSEAMASKKED
eukprot:XP_001701168.1 predicted protein [Chlamydomonas reinhardtii]